MAPMSSTARSADLGIVELAGPGGDLVARFAVGAGMVGCSLRHRGEELLGIGRGLRGYLEDGAVFGIPLLYPWANRLGGWSYEAAGRAVVLDRDCPLLHGEEHCLPIHGALAASSAWRVTGRGSDEDSAWLESELDFAAHPELLAVFPFPHRLELAIRIGPTALSVTTEVIADSGSAVPLSFGFHPYLALPGAVRERWQVALPARTELALDERRLPTGGARPRPAASFVLGERTFDDLFAVPDSPARFSVSGGGRRLTVELRSGFPYAQIFAPPEEPVICFEPMTAPIDALRSHDGLRVVEPGATARSEFTLAVEEI
jgi:galactose mutarotase-like enzyme